ncbi:hypothetical protein [Pasteurella sp. PK-2025]|uniref:hypothetical protein n=1 Tax=Pasteurella sp. PK-2025 TaxID=3413133 RepID=UPI003C733218
MMDYLKISKMKDQDDFSLFGMDYLENDTDSQFFIDLNELEVLLERTFIVQITRVFDVSFRNAVNFKKFCFEELTVFVS